MIGCKRHIIQIMLLLGIILIPQVGHAEIFYIMPRLGLNIALIEKGNVSNKTGVVLKPNGTSATFVASLAGGVHFSRVPIRLEVDISFRTDSRLKDVIGGDYIKTKLYQLTPMLNIYYDIYIPNFSVVPYVGVGIGFTTFFADTKAKLGSSYYTSDALASVQFAWAVMAGLTFPIDKFLLDVAFRFADSGKGKVAAGDLSGTVRAMNFDFLLGVRFPL